MGKGPNQPRRIVTRLLVFLLLGAVVNVAVAWGCVGIAPFYRLDRPVAWPRDLGVLDWHDRRWLDGTGYQLPSNLQFVSNESVGLGINKKFYMSARRNLSDDGVLVLTSYTLVHGTPVRTAAGWPSFALEGGYSSAGTGGPNNAPIAMRSINAIGLPSWLASRPGFTERRLPLMPIWPGFAINTIFYAAILWLLWAAPGAIRRMRRRKRGLCIHCAYDLRGSPADSANCPECGAAKATRGT